ncbi:protein phosphatase 2C domain-containing protein [Actinocorallia sp. A-T 12471]|uniref:protein phosphatase 2C domain-containing protein n=1 Tax=Actinocorallia sp. A-T 12471 TaxID=3089813 RepID=UPI0029CE238C|nr:protein phosphatase 2C domain-containing protein [Actinocorallia sp. A-T 12471]MDX6739282.1 protein phosphatase 2C domain-containing protein [Actinocorallia sp. A-T 12471]
MKVSWATRAVPRRDWPNEDFVAAAEGAVVVLDGCSLPPGTDLGCRHGTAWYARSLGLEMLGRMLEPPTVPMDRGNALRACLAASIEAVALKHADTCDLSHRATPAATVLALRERPEGVEYLVLADSVLLLDSGGSVEVVSHEYARTYAAADPSAASRAITGARPPGALRRAALLTDGATRLTDRFKILGWQELLTLLAADGPEALIDQTRSAEDADPDCQRWPRTKRHDDATAALVVLEPRREG